MMEMWLIGQVAWQIVEDVLRNSRFATSLPKDVQSVVLSSYLHAFQLAPSESHIWKDPFCYQAVWTNVGVLVMSLCFSMLTLPILVCVGERLLR